MTGLYIIYVGDLGGGPGSIGVRNAIYIYIYGGDLGGGLAENVYIYIYGGDLGGGLPHQTFRGIGAYIYIYIYIYIYGLKSDPPPK